MCMLRMAMLPLTGGSSIIVSKDPLLQESYTLKCKAPGSASFQWAGAGTFKMQHGDCLYIGKWLLPLGCRSAIGSVPGSLTRMTLHEVLAYYHGLCVRYHGAVLGLGFDTDIPATP